MASTANTTLELNKFGELMYLPRQLVPTLPFEGRFNHGTGAVFLFASQDEIEA